MNPSSSSGNQDNDRKQKRKATAEPETKPKRVRITYDPLKVNPFEAMISGNYSRRVYQPLDGTPQSPPSSQTSTPRCLLRRLGSQSFGLCSFLSLLHLFSCIPRL